VGNKIAKLAAREKKIAAAKPKCPDPNCTGDAEHILYVPPKGRSKKALRCLKTGKIWVLVRPGGAWERVGE
jgi:hypothetical protein